MKIMTILLSLNFLQLSQAQSPWIQNLSDEDKLQLEYVWKASGGQADLKLIYPKFHALGIEVSPHQEHPDKNWDQSHLVYNINDLSHLNLQMPFGNIEKVTGGKLLLDTNLKLKNNKHLLNITQIQLEPMSIAKNKGDIVNFKLKDQYGRHLFDINSIHIQYDKERKLLLMNNMDLFATKTLAELLDKPVLENQVLGQLHIYNHLVIPKNAITDMERGLSCADRPVWPPGADADVALINIGTVQWMRNVSGDRIVVAPSATLKNVGDADVPWHQQFTGPQDPYGNDQHPFLNWGMYREIDNRFEQIAYSGVKHAFLTINFNCTINCGDNHILWPGCEDVYGTGNNDSSFDLGPRAEIEAFQGLWENCGSFFDPEPCTGSHQQSSNGQDENRLTVHTSDLTDPDNGKIYMQAWYLIRDDVNIYNSMGYVNINPMPSGGGWSMNSSGNYTNKPSIEDYVPNNTATQAIDKVVTSEGHFTVAVKVIDLGGGQYRYNYAVENYDFDPRFISYTIDLDDDSSFINEVFADPDNDSGNDWSFIRDKDSLTVSGQANNEQDWGMMFSFSFTTDAPPISGNMSIRAAHPNINGRVNAEVLVPELNDLIYANSFD